MKMSRIYQVKPDSDIEIKKVVTLKPIQAAKLDEFRNTFSWSARKAASFCLAYTHKIETVVKPVRLLRSKPTIESKPRNLFIAMTCTQVNNANDLAAQLSYDFTTLLKISFDTVYTEWKNGKLNFYKNDETKKFIDKTVREKYLKRKINQN